MKKLGFAALAASIFAVAAAPVFAGMPDAGGEGQAVVTLLPKNGSEAPVRISAQDLRLRVNGKDSTVTGWEHLHHENGPLELVILMDSSARASIGTQLGEIKDFVNEMPSHAKMAIAYMDSGRAVFETPLSSDPAVVLKALHIPGGIPGQSASPYFCLSDLAKNWPSHDTSARREVLMITDGVDYYNLRYDPQDPYVQAAIEDSTKAGLVVYSIYWVNQGHVDRTWYENNAGQNLLEEVTQATGGSSYWQGFGNPVSFEPYFKDLRQRFEHQYRLSFTSPLKGKPQVESMNLKVGGPAAKVYAPQQVFVRPAGTAVAGD